MLRIAVIEQNEFMKERLLGHIRQFSEKEVPCTSVVFTDELEFLESYNFTFDVVLVAVGLRLFDGVEIAKKIRARDERVEIVFVAQDDANAIDGYAVDAADYLLYPVGYDRFAAAMRRANARLARKQGGAFIVKVKGVYRRLLARDSLAVLGAEEPPAGAKEREDVAADARE